VTSVDPEGQAGSRGVKLGDRMIEINGKMIPNNMPDPVLAEMLFGLPRPITLGFRFVSYERPPHTHMNPPNLPASVLDESCIV
jgi:hypothetical protein